LSECEGKLELTLEELLLEKRYSKDFKKWYLLPMGGCIWSCPKNELLKFPAFTFLKFCLNHGLLQIYNRPKWETVLNGCNTYVEKVLKGIDKKFLNEPVRELKSLDGKLNLTTDQRTEKYDFCIICTHPPEALKILKDSEPQTKDILYKFKFQENKAILHLDESVLPDKKIAWSAWNYTSTKSNDGKDKVSVSYLINKLQPLPFKESVIVTLNPVTTINKDKIIKTISYQHPLFSTESIKAQGKIDNIQGSNGIYFSGAWMRYGFHEDGIYSTKKAIKKLLSDDSLNNNLINIL
jgi:predicted NAD/FAD-binding protein